MGKMNFNSKMLCDSSHDTKNENSIVEVIDNNSYTLRKNTGNLNHTVSVRYDAVSNISRDIRIVLNTAISVVGDIIVECNRTKQIQAQSQACIRVAEEQTKQVRIQEKENTKRYKMQCETELKKAKYELQEKLAEINNRKEIIYSNERILNAQIDEIRKIIDFIIEKNRELIKTDGYTEEADRNMGRLMQLVTLLANIGK